TWIAGTTTERNGDSVMRSSSSLRGSWVRAYLLTARPSAPSYSSVKRYASPATVIRSPSAVCAGAAPSERMYSTIVRASSAGNPGCGDITASPHSPEPPEMTFAASRATVGAVGSYRSAIAWYDGPMVCSVGLWQAAQ